MHDARDRNAGIWIEHNDRLYVATYSSVASLVVMFSGYFRKMNGDIIEYAVTVNPTSDRAVTAATQHFGAGFLLSCVVSLTSGSANRGQCYVRAQIQRSAGTPAIKLHGVVGGYVTDDYSPSFPYGSTQGPLEGSGYLRHVTGTDPAVGGDVSELVPTGARWAVLSVAVNLAVDATVVNRYVGCDFYRATFYLTSVISTQAQVANSPRQYLFMPDVEHLYVAATAQEIIAIPQVSLAAGDEIAMYAVGMAAGDDFGAPDLYVEEWIEA